MPATPDVIAFDVIETLFSVRSLEPLVIAAGGDGSTLGRWFDHLLADGMALTAAGGYRSFSDVARVALHAVLPDASDRELAPVLNGLTVLDAHPDSAAAMGRAVQGSRVVVLTNGSARSATKLIERAGLDTFVEEVISVSAVKAWKPAPAPYLHAASVTGVPPEALAVATAHPWDVHGAHAAGATTGWCNRGGGRFPATFTRADVEGPELLTVVEKLLSLSGLP